MQSRPFVHYLQVHRPIAHMNDLNGFCTTWVAFFKPIRCVAEIVLRVLIFYQLCLINVFTTRYEENSI